MKDYESFIFQGGWRLFFEGLKEEKGEEYKPVTPAFVGRMLTDIGLDNMTKTLQETVIESTKTDEGKNA